MDPSEVINGEELEECTHKARGKLFRLVNKEWAEMGIGNLKVRTGGRGGWRRTYHFVVGSKERARLEVGGRHEPGYMLVARR